MNYFSHIKIALFISCISFRFCSSCKCSILVSLCYRASGKIPRAILEMKNILYLNFGGDEDMIDQGNWELVNHVFNSFSAFQVSDLSRIHLY